jgi:hypothetical protein
MYSPGKSAKLHPVTTSFGSGRKFRKPTPAHRKTNPWIKEDVIQALKEGLDNDKILLNFPGLSKQSLAALRAHMTRGSYD